MKLVFATRNRGKLRELREILLAQPASVAPSGQLVPLDLLCLDDVGYRAEIDETGATFAENAALKARAVLAATGLPALADDSGLEVDALGGAPGVCSARYAGPGASDAQRIEVLLRNLRDVPPERRTARFRCAVAFALPVALRPTTAPAAGPGPGSGPPSGAETGIVIHEGTCEGKILTAPRGTGGFGYDPVFLSSELGLTFAEAAPEDKNRVSHRGRAMRQMAVDLADLADLAARLRRRAPA